FYHSLHFTFAFGLYKGHYTYPMVAQFSTGILAHFSISIYSSCDFPSYLSFPHGLLEMKRGYSSCPVIFYIQKVNAQS
ncbi:MAG: hypothetical protein SO231_11950, partial [Phocaeicola vulgatus]|nr:hypothetical protein [Phocaeicola vulgatus]